jgi:hypothetical protein
MRQRQPTADDVDTVVLESRPAENAEPEEDLIQVERWALVRQSSAAWMRACQQLLTLLFYTEPRPTYDTIVQTLGCPRQYWPHPCALFGENDDVSGAKSFF